MTTQQQHQSTADDMTIEMVVWRDWGIASEVVKAYDLIRKQFVAELAPHMQDVLNRETEDTRTPSSSETEDTRTLLFTVSPSTNGRGVLAEFKWRASDGDPPRLGSIAVELDESDGPISCTVNLKLPQRTFPGATREDARAFLNDVAQDDGPTDEDRDASKLVTGADLAIRRVVGPAKSVDGGVPMAEFIEQIEEAVVRFMKAPLRFGQKYFGDAMEESSKNQPAPGVSGT